MNTTPSPSSAKEDVARKADQSENEKKSSVADAGNKPILIPGGVDLKKSKHHSSSTATWGTTTCLLGLLIAVVVGVYINFKQFGYEDRTKSESNSTKVFTQRELGTYDGRQRPQIFLAILGEVFDVTAGKQHYGEAEGYGRLAGKDGSRAFVTGDFHKDTNDDIRDLDAKRLVDLDSWRQFYHDNGEYFYKGVVAGRFYQSDGSPTSELFAIRAKINEGKRQRVIEKDEEEKHPRCNTKWEAGKGGEVWCSDAGHFPRRVEVNGNKRCGCFTPKELAELTTLELYPGCDKAAKLCRT